MQTIIIIENKKYIEVDYVKEYVEESLHNKCFYCAFSHNERLCLHSSRPNCTPAFRSDHRDIYFLPYVKKDTRTCVLQLDTPLLQDVLCYPKEIQQVTLEIEYEIYEPKTEMRSIEVFNVVVTNIDNWVPNPQQDTIILNWLRKHEDLDNKVEVACFEDFEKNYL